MLPHPEVRQALEQCDDDYFNDGPLNKLSKLLTCVQKAGSSDLIKWVILGAIDAYHAGVIDQFDGSSSDSFSVRSLAGDNRYGKIGFIQVLAYKYECKMLMLNRQWLLKLMPSADTVIKTFQHVLENHSNYRSLVQPFKAADGEELDVSWQHNWSRPNHLTFQFLEQLVYGKIYNMSIRSMIRAGKTVAEALEYCVPMKEAMEYVQKAIDAEKEERKQTEGEAEERPRPAELVDPDDMPTHEESVNEELNKICHGPHIYKGHILTHI